MYIPWWAIVGIVGVATLLAVLAWRAISCTSENVFTVAEVHDRLARNVEEQEEQLQSADILLFGMYAITL